MIADPVMALGRLQRLKLLQEVRIADPCLVADGQTPTQLVEFIIAQDEHERVQHTTEILFRQKAGMVLVEFVERFT